MEIGYERGIAPLTTSGRLGLARMSIRDLAQQLAAAVVAATAERRLPLQRLGNWLVMTA